MTPYVLVIDDDKPFCQVITEALQEDGFHVLGAMNADKALELVDVAEPDLILLDMCMPGMDGPAFIHGYRERQGRHAPIVLISATDDLARKAAELGADSYLSKPIESADLLALVRYYTRT
jgi:CheY-like chemotaxis protein